MSSDPDPSDRAASFGEGADAYRRARPGYPEEAVRWLLPAGRCRVVDLAAGTGKLTEQLHALGHDVVAVEPSAGMRRALEELLPQVPSLGGSAEAIPLPYASADAVVVAQAWHWFDTARAVPEIARVLRPGGRLGIVWNVAPHQEGWVGAYSEILHQGQPADPSDRTPDLQGLFSSLEHHSFLWEHVLAASDLRTLAASHSRVLVLPPEERAPLLDEVDALTRTHPDLAGRDVIAVPYRSECWRADLA